MLPSVLHGLSAMLAQRLIQIFPALENKWHDHFMDPYRTRQDMMHDGCVAQSACNIWMGHSWGFHQLWQKPEDYRRQVTAAVSINGFMYLPQETAEPASLSQSNVMSMLRAMQIDPEKTLQRFYKAAGLSKTERTRHLAYFLQPALIDLLQQELMTMATSCVHDPDQTTNPVLPFPIPVLALAATGDKIVTRQITEQSFAATPKNPLHQGLHQSLYQSRNNARACTQLYYADTTSHCLPLTHPEWCAMQMVRWLSACL